VKRGKRVPKRERSQKKGGRREKEGKERRGVTECTDQGLHHPASEDEKNS